MIHCIDQRPKYNHHYELKLGINNSLRLYKSTESGILSVKEYKSGDSGQLTADRDSLQSAIDRFSRLVQIYVIVSHHPLLFHASPREMFLSVHSWQLYTQNVSRGDAVRQPGRFFLFVVLRKPV
jgi:hypothetical protein